MACLKSKMMISSRLVQLCVIVANILLCNNLLAQDVATILETVNQSHYGVTEKTVSSNETFDTDSDPIFYFTSFTVASGQILTVSGSNPLVVIADIINIHGTIDVSGGDGQNASEGPNGGGNGAGGGAGGGGMFLAGKTSITIHSGAKLMANGGDGGHAGGQGQASFSGSPWHGTQAGGNGQGGIGVAGGFNGGNGGPHATPPSPASAGLDGGGPGGGGGTPGYMPSAPNKTGVPPGGGGGGYGTAGQKGFSQYWGGGNTNGGAAGSAYGNSDIDILFGGSGGGGGGNDNDNEEGAGGGGAGGSIYLYSANITTLGTIEANGGVGGLDDYNNNLTHWTAAFNNGGTGGTGRIRSHTNTALADLPAMNSSTLAENIDSPIRYIPFKSQYVLLGLMALIGVWFLLRQH